MVRARTRSISSSAMSRRPPCITAATLPVRISSLSRAGSPLLRDHVPDSNGRCRACGLPGSGSPYLRWPCGLYSIANAARNLRLLRIARG